MNNPGHIYIMTNEAFAYNENDLPLIKVGMTFGNKTPEDRARELSSATGVPLSFEVLHAVYVENLNVEQVERALHSIMDEERVNPKREFFYKDPRTVIPMLNLLGTPVVVREDSAYLDKADVEAIEKRKKQRPFRFSDIPLEIGTVLTFVEDSSLTVTIVTDRKVRIDATGEITSLSRAAEEYILRTHGKETRCFGPGYWKYGDKTIGELLNDVGFYGADWRE